MAQANLAKTYGRPLTHEGAPAQRITDEQLLRRSVLACFLWEDSFYEDGVSIAQRIYDTALRCKPGFVSTLAIEARLAQHLRHAPLLLLSALAKTGAGSNLLSLTIPQVINRADELAELIAVHAAANGVTPDKVKPVLSAQMKKGLAKAFTKFDEYQLAKYNRAKAVTLRDVLFLSHAKPQSEEQAALWKRLVEDQLATPETWEVGLSAGKDKAEVFTNLIKSGKLGYLALLRNLRNMDTAGVDPMLVADAITARKGAHNVLPFRYIMAERMAPMFSVPLDRAFQAAVEDQEDIGGLTVIAVDCSGSMSSAVSGRSKVARNDAAAGLAAIFPGRKRIIAFGTNAFEVPARKGLAQVDAIKQADTGWGTDIDKAVKLANSWDADRIIVISDEQSHTPVSEPNKERNYMINVAAYQNGVGYHGKWTHIDGWSENTIRFIREYESFGRE